MQIYCERLSDLLGNDTDELSIRDRPAHDGGGVYVRNATRVPVTTPRQALDLLAAGDSKRATASTLMNEFSSRSHAVALLHVERKTKDSLQRSTLTLVDLAGSERHAACAGRYKRLEESRAINLGLSALGNCVSALAERRPHVPYRDSKLTRLLQASLGGTARTALIACCAPGGDATGETKSTLEFAARARKVVVRAAPRDVAVDYQSLYEEVKDSIDDYRTRERKALDEVESLKDKEEATQSRILELERENDALKHALQRQQRPVVEGDQVDVIEQLHAKFNDDTEEAERRHAAELRTAQSRADAKIKAYRDAAEVSARECDAAEAALTGEREGHLASLKGWRRVKAEFRETEARHAARVSELIEEVAAAKGEGEAKAQEADKAADALLKRVETLEVSRQEQLETDYVSRDAVAEMEKLFRSTIDALAARLEDLEGKRVSDVAAGRSRGRVSAARARGARVARRGRGPRRRCTSGSGAAARGPRHAEHAPGAAPTAGLRQARDPARASAVNALVVIIGPVPVGDAARRVGGAPAARARSRRGRRRRASPPSRPCARSLLSTRRGGGGTPRRGFPRRSSVPDRRDIAS